MSRETDAGCGGADPIHSDRLATLGQLAAGVAHEINNPLAYLRSNLDTLDEYVADLLELLDLYRRMQSALPPEHPGRREAERARERIGLEAMTRDLGDILAESREGMNLVTEIVSALRDFARESDEAPTLTDVNVLLERALRLAHNELKYHVGVRRELSELPLIPARPGRLTQVFLNLVVNAAQAIRDRGTLTVRSWVADECLHVELEDDGCGLPEGDEGRIFEPFFTTKPAGQGTGLGLSVVWEIVAEHRGSVTARPRPGGGACFRVSLPLAGPG
jgi:signal transduction histidine kinase